MNKRIKYTLLFIIILIVFISMYTLNKNTILLTDDFIYQYVFTSRFPTADTKLLTNFFDLFVSMANHWELWGGRVVVHFLLQLSFFLGIRFFNIINSLTFVLLGIMIYLHINNNIKNIKLLLLILIYSFVFLFIPQPSATIIWKSGSANYLWSSVIILIMTLLYKRNFEKNNIKDNTLNVLLFFIVGIITGCCNENAGCALIITIIIFIIFNKIKYSKIPRWMILNLVGTILGYAFLLSAPGNFIRANQLDYSVDHSINGIINCFFKITRLTHNYLYFLIILVIATTVFLFNKKKNIREYIDNYGIQFIFIVFSLVSIYSLIISPTYPERCWMFAFVYLTIVVGINITELISSGKYRYFYKKIFIIITIVLSIEAISTYNEAYYDILNSKEYIDNQIKQIKSDIKSGEKNIKVHGMINSVGKYNALAENDFVSYNADSWTNRWVAKYYGVDSIVVED